jgi:hypothetical protein
MIFSTQFILDKKSFLKLRLTSFNANREMGDLFWLSIKELNQYPLVDAKFIVEDEERVFRLGRVAFVEEGDVTALPLHLVEVN